MKTIKLFTILAVSGLTLIFTACADSLNSVDDSSDELKSTYFEESSTYNLEFTGDLTDADIAGLMEMREEEKLARDVYIQLYNTHNFIVFNNISKSENAHMSAVLYLIAGYGLEDPALTGEGEFSNPVFSDLYKQLTEEGEADLVSGLKIGAFIEEYDIADLKRLIAETENADIKRVYGNLLRGSTFHLRAFTSSLSRQGVTYEPSILTAEEYQEIIGS